MAMVAGAASAQYTCNPEIETVLEKGKVSTVWACVLDETSSKAFEAQGAEVINCMENGENIFFYIWPDTGNSFTAGDSSFPGVGMHFDGYLSLNVGSIGWSGAGMSVGAPGVNTTAWTDDTHFHMAYMSNGTVDPNVQMVVADGADKGSMPAKFALGTSLEGEPVAGPASSDDWQGLDMTFGELKKLYPTFAPKAVEDWQGNIFSVVGGAVTGQNISLDAVYYYNLADDSSVAAVAADELSWVVTENTLNVNGAAGVELYNLAGQLVKGTRGSVIGLSDLNAGVYVARCGNAVRKVVVK